MHFQGKDLVSVSTQKSARTLLSTSVVIVLAKYYDVLPADLDLLGVKISSAAVAGSVPVVVGLQALNHIVNWLGDLFSSPSWNSKDRVNGMARISAGSAVLTRIDKSIESIDEFIIEWGKGREFGQKNTNLVEKQLERIISDFSEIKPSIERFNKYGIFYVWIWYLFLPVGIALMAMVNLET